MRARDAVMPQSAGWHSKMVVARSSRQQSAMLRARRRYEAYGYRSSGASRARVCAEVQVMHEARAERAAKGGTRFAQCAAMP